MDTSPELRTNRGVRGCSLRPNCRRSTSPEVMIVHARVPVRTRAYSARPCRRSSPAKRPSHSGEIDRPRRDRGAGRARVAGAPGALRRLHRHVLAGQRQVGRLRRGLRLLRAVALRRGRDAAARDDGARADPRARPGGRGGRRAPLLHGHPGPGPVQARLREGARGRAARRRAHEPQALRVDRPHERRARQGAQGRGHPARAPQRRDGGVLLPRGLLDGPLRGPAAHDRRGRARPGWRPASAASSTSARSREQRVEMAFQLAEINPTSVPINLLNPRPGTKFGDRDYMDPWEAVKWIAIFRLILPDALFRLCGGRVENLGELQPLAVKAGAQRRDDGQLPDDARHARPRRTARCSRSSGSTSPASADNGANPRPDNRSRLAGRRDARRRRGAPRHARRRRSGRHRDPAVGSRRRSCASPRRTSSRPGPTARRTAGPRAARPRR